MKLAAPLFHQKSISLRTSLASFSVVTLLGLGLISQTGLVTAQTTLAAPSQSGPTQAAPAQPTTFPETTTSTNQPEELELVATPIRIGDDATLTGKPGDTLQTSIRVRNTSNKPVAIRTLIKDFVVEEDGETPMPIEEAVSSRWSLASWVTIAPAEQLLQPNQSGQATIIITIPQDALPGGHYAMALHQPTGSKLPEPGTATTQDSASVVNQRVGTLLYVTVEGPTNESAFIRDLTIPKFTEFGPVPFGLTVDNQSDIHIKPKVSLEVYNWFGSKVETIEVESKNVFPLMSRNFTGTWDRVWGIGLYKAKAVVSYGTQGQVVLAQQYFWLLPITLLMSGGVVLLVLLAVSVAVRRHILHKKNDQSNKIAELEQKLAEVNRTQNQPPSLS
jgi:hypothetical protein